MKGGELRSNIRVDQCQEEENNTTKISVLNAKNEPNSLSLCSLTTPSTSSGSIFIVRSTTTPLTQGKKYIDVQLLTREHLYLAVDVKCEMGDIYRYVCSHIGLQCISLFGLACYVENEYRFCEQDERLSKYAPKNWQKAPGWGTDLVGNPSVIFYLRVHTYIDYVRLINCPVSLLHYYLQLRENVRIQWEPSWVAEERCFEVAALALQSDYGDYRSDKHTTGYFRADAYFPMWVINGRGLDYVLRHLPSMHHDLQGLEPYEARIRYCREVSTPPCPVNMHLYRLRRSKTDTQDTIYMGITARGLELFEQKPSGDRQHLMSFSWSKIGKLAFDRKKFTLASLDGQKMVFYTCSDEKSRYLLNFCRSVHQNIIRLQAVILEARKREVDERKQFRESYIYSDTADLDWIRKTDAQTPTCDYYEYNFVASSTTNLTLNTFPRHNTPNVTGNGGVVVCCTGGGQRVSLVSDASSNTTSGIVSDRQHTHDDSENENENDADFEITTGCDSSPLVSELSLATSGTSPPLCMNGSQNSQQASPVYPSAYNEHVQRESFTKYSTTVAIDLKPDINQESGYGTYGDEEIEGESSVGPSSDRTVTAAADDTQSTETTSTTGKLDDLCTETEVASAPAQNTIPVEERFRQWPADIRTSKRGSNVTTPNFGSVSIAELRRQTLHDYTNPQPSFQRRASPPVLPLRPPPSASVLEELKMPERVISQDEHAPKLPSLLSTQISNSLLLPSVETLVDRGDASNLNQGNFELVQNESMTLNQLAFAERNKAYGIVSSQVSNECFQNEDGTVVFDNRSTPSPPKLETVVVEPPPPPPYPYDMNAGIESKSAQSYSMTNLPSSSSSSFGRNGSISINEYIQQAPIGRMPPTSVEALPNYEQALQYKVELGRRLATSTNLDQSSITNIPWFHSSTAKRWPTVSGIHPTVLDQLVSSMGARRLQQAQSEPGLAAPYYAADDYASNRQCCNDMGPYGNPYVCSPYAAMDPLFDNGINGAYRSVSTYQLSNGMARPCACQHQYLPPPPSFHHPPHHLFQAPYPQYTNNPQPVANCTPSGLYVKQPRGQRSNAISSAGYRMHAAECQQSASQLLYNGTGPSHSGSKAVARVHSMYEAAKADHVRRSLENEYYRRFERQVVQDTKRKLREQQLQLERQLAASLNNTNDGSNQPSLSDNLEMAGETKQVDNTEDHNAPGHYCDTCQENHTAGKIDLAQLKDIIRSQNIDLPLMRALCNDRSFNQQVQPSDNSTKVDDSAAHPLLRQKRHSPSQITKPIADSSNGRPLTWHESFYEMQAVASSSWPPYEFSCDR